MTLRDAIETIKAEPVVASSSGDAALTGCFAADLMSDVLAFGQAGGLLVTGLATDQTIRTAAIKHMAAVMLVEGKSASAEMLESADEEGVALYSTPLSKYEVCGLLLQAGLRPYRKGATVRR